MYAQGRTMLQASIDERAEVLSRLIAMAPELIHLQFEGYAKEAEDEAKANSNGDWDVYISMYHSFLDSYRLYDEAWMVEEFYRSMVLAICSFAECALKGVLADPNQRFKSNYVCCALKQIKQEQNLCLNRIGRYWKDYQAFIQKRNDIAHSRCEVRVSEQELYEALDGVHALLRAVADALDAKQRAAKAHVH